jgi:hypothetical protein
MTQEEQKQILATVASTIVALCGAGLNQKQAAFMAWRADRLSEQLRTGICHFSYTKKDGTLRHARGTLRTDLIPAEFQPHGNERARNLRPAPISTSTVRHGEVIVWRLWANVGFMNR